MIPENKYAENTVSLGDLGEGWRTNYGYRKPPNSSEIDVIFKNGACQKNTQGDIWNWEKTDSEDPLDTAWDIAYWRDSETDLRITSEDIENSLSKRVAVVMNTPKKLDFHGEFGELSKEEQNSIINPKHYKILPKEAMRLFLEKGMEYMDIMRYTLAKHVGVKAHVLGQVFKYAFRLGGKDDELQDAKKIAWYANRLVEEIEFERGLTQNFPRGDF